MVYTDGLNRRQQNNFSLVSMYQGFYTLYRLIYKAYNNSIPIVSMVLDLRKPECKLKKLSVHTASGAGTRAAFRIELSFIITSVIKFRLFRTVLINVMINNTFQK